MAAETPGQRMMGRLRQAAAVPASTPEIAWGDPFLSVYYGFMISERWANCKHDLIFGLVDRKAGVCYYGFVLAAGRISCVQRTVAGGTA